MTTLDTSPTAVLTALMALKAAADPARVGLDQVHAAAVIETAAETMAAASRLHDARVTELLTANNAAVDRRRAAVARALAAEAREAVLHWVLGAVARSWLEARGDSKALHQAVIDMSGAVGKALDDTTSAAAAHDARVREEGRRAGIEEAARVAEGRPYKGRYRTWPWWTNPDGSQGNRANESDLVQHADKTAAAIRALAAAPATPPPFDLVAHLHRQRAFSERTFGPGQRTKGVVDHIRKELSEIEADPADVMEWVDVIILGFDGAWRAGWTPEAIVVAMVEKQTRNEARSWPDWRNVDPDRAIEHDRTAENGCRNG